MLGGHDTDRRGKRNSLRVERGYASPPKIAKTYDVQRPLTSLKIAI